MTGDPSIVGVDLSELGSNLPSYSPNQAYAVTGPGNIYWTDGGTWWVAYLPIQPGTKGEDPPLFGLLLIDGDDGTAKGYFIYMGLGTYTFYKATNYVVEKTFSAESTNPTYKENFKPFQEK